MSIKNVKVAFNVIPKMLQLQNQPQLKLVKGIQYSINKYSLGLNMRGHKKNWSKINEMGTTITMKCDFFH